MSPSPTREPQPNILQDSVLAFGRTQRPIPFGAANNALTDLFFLLVCKDSKTHLQVLARLGRLLRKDEFLRDLREAEDAAAAYSIITAADQAIG
ncbi:MAG: PTS sugar transporter subunit IIA [Planctomycetaceae bacterium]